ncbi:uncharacterized protein LOC111373706 [Olea europaea var. sylvestris]|uniref:uncharacterized protein LOC111373706 n=1 Tax=Olea europaea var. sylvestris TaxID=158386 RepID=UPI000C1D4977|nr:uncharacterized protein LOC111373706 [Olea europaea var. sylvestris]
MRDHKETEFLRLVQEDMELSEYENKFEELFRYAPHLVSTELMKVKRYERSLCLEIRILSVSNILVYVLIDVGATHSFISNACLAKINASCQKNDSVPEVSMPSGGTIDTDRIAKGVRIDFDGLTLEADLPGKEEFRFYRSRIKALPRIISALKPESMLRKTDYQGYLISLTNTSTQEKVNCDVPIVREYVDVFPEDLPGTLPDRQVEFTIDLIPGATPMSKAPYRMALKEYKS